MPDLSVFTLNVWGIGCGISADREPRIKAISHFLAASSFDIVLLQELWMPADYSALRTITKESLPYQHFFDNGIIGSGTCILSRHPILETTFHEFSLNGYPHKVSHGDWFAGKGLGVCQISYQDLIVNVFVSHLHAEYCRNRDIYLGHRVLQALEAAQWIRLTSSGADLTIYAGDFNTEPTDVPFNILRQVGGLQDAWVEANGNKEGGGTCAAPYNTYTTTQEKTEFPCGKRIDYILYSSGPTVKAAALECTLPLPQRIPLSINYKQLSYSDHEGVSALLRLEGEQGNGGHNIRHSPERGQCLESAATLVRNAVEATRKDRFVFLSFSFFAILFFLFSFAEYFMTETYLTFSLVFIARCFLILTGIFCALMGSVFNRKEKNALLGALSSLNLMLNSARYGAL